MPTTTSNYDLLKPLVNNATDQDLWGGQLNDDMDDIDTLLRAGITFATQSSQTSGFNADASISVKKLYPCDAMGSGFTVNIPEAATAGNGAVVAIKKTDSTSNAVTLARAGSDTLDGATSLTLDEENACWVLVSNGVDGWNSIGKPFPNIPDASTTEKGIIEIATDAEARAGSDTTRAVTSAGLASNKSLTTSGYYEFPGGMILQWGSTPCTGVTTTVSLPMTFPNNIFTAVCSLESTTTGATDERHVSSKSTSQIIFVTYNTLGSINWFAIGN